METAVVYWVNIWVIQGCWKRKWKLLQYIGLMLGVYIGRMENKMETIGLLGGDDRRVVSCVEIL